MITAYNATPDIDVLTSSFPIPGFGLVPINAFVLHGPEPLLVDTGAVVEREEFINAGVILFCRARRCSGAPPRPHPSPCAAPAESPRP
mgnify:CR=1 FL=1